MAEQFDKNQFYKTLLAFANDPKGFNSRNGVLVTEVGEGWAKGEMENSPLTHNVLGSIHGGALSTFADTVAAVAVASFGGLAMTSHNTMEYLRAAKPGPVFCEARVRKPGKALSVCETVIRDSEGRELAIGHFSFHMTGDPLPFYRGK